MLSLHFKDFNKTYYYKLLYCMAVYYVLLNVKTY